LTFKTLAYVIETTVLILILLGNLNRKINIQFTMDLVDEVVVEVVALMEGANMEAVDMFIGTVCVITITTTMKT
jgi:hypothetical protein